MSDNNTHQPLSMSSPAPFPAIDIDTHVILDDLDDDSDEGMKHFDDMIKEATERRSHKPSCLRCFEGDESYYRVSSYDKASSDRRKVRKIIAFSLFMLLLGTALGVAMGSARYPSPPPSSPPSSQPDISSLKEQSYLPPDKYKGVVAADDGLCSDLGANLMKTTSANAIDAAVATALCLGVVNPGSSGIGGGCFILFHDSSTSSTSFIDSREFAPAAASSTMYDNLPPTSSTDGPYAAAVPAELKGLEKVRRDNIEDSTATTMRM